MSQAKGQVGEQGREVGCASREEKWVGELGPEVGWASWDQSVDR